MSSPVEYPSAEAALEAARTPGGAESRERGGRVRFVVLRHTGVAEPHFDLLLQLPGWPMLLTWRVTSPEPAEWGLGGEEPLMGRRIQDHREAYMTYEGEVSGGRGVVKRVMEGRVRVIGLTEGMLRILEEGGKWELGLPMEGSG